MLVSLGLDRKKVYRQKSQSCHYFRGSILRASDSELYEILEIARDNFRTKLRRVHPDNPDGGNAEEAGELIRVWKRVQFLFARRGIELWK